MKKNSVILRIACLCLALLMVMALPALADGPAVLTLDAPSGPVAAGDTFDVSVSLKGNPGINSVSFVLGFDQSRLVCTGIDQGALIKGMLFASKADNPLGAKIAGVTLNAVEGDGVVAVFHMQATANVDKLVFTLSECSLSDVDGNPFAVTVEVPTQPYEPGPDTPPVSTEPPEVTPTPEPGGQVAPAVIPAFSDVNGHWGIDYIMKAAEKGLFKGYEDGRFGPDDPVTRAQFVTVLYRMAGSPEASGSMPFEDTDGLIEEFKKAISWAYGNGYVNGRSDTVFDPGGRITRQEAMKILFAYSGGVSGMEAMFTGIYDDAYSDSGDIASWAKSAMYWGVYHELIKGMGDGVIAPLGTATRAQLAKILVVYSEKF